MLSPSESFFSAASCRIAAAANCFVTDPIRYTVRGVAATSFSRSAFPAASTATVSAPRVIATATLGAPPWATKSCTSESVT